MANTYTESKIVNLYDQRSSGILLEPATELRAVTISSGGIVQIEGNSIWVDPADSGLSDIYAQKTEVGSLAYTSLTAEASGGTHTVYGGTVTGTGIITSHIDVTTTVRTPYTSASNDRVPTERAVAFGLDTKQDYLISGTGILIEPDGNNRPVISVDVVQTIAELASASPDKIPSESATRYAIDSCYNAIAGSGGLLENYADSAWCLETFYQKGETPGSGGGDVPFANYTTAGKVMPIQSQGLIIGGGGSMTVQSAGVYATYASASSYPHGAVRVVNAVSSAADAYKGVAYVPHAHAVWAHVSNALLSYVPKTQYPTAGSAGIVRVGDGLAVSAQAGTTTSDTIYLKTATTTSSGGVMLATTLTGTMNSATLPTGAAISTYIASVLQPYQPTLTFTSGVSKVTNTNSVCLEKATTAALGGVIVGEGLDVYNGTISLAEGAGAVVSGGSGVTVTSSGSTYTIDLKRATRTTLGGLLVGSGLGYKADGTVSLKIPFTVRANTDLDADVTGGYVIKDGSQLFFASNDAHVAIPAGTSGGADYMLYLRVYYHTTQARWLWEYTTTLGTTTDTNKYYPLALITTNASSITNVRQIQYGNLDMDTYGGGGGTTTAEYNGPFAVTSTGNGTVSVGAGIVYELDTPDPIAAATGVSLASGETLYLYGSSGCTDASHLHTVISGYTASVPNVIWAGEFYTPIASNDNGVIVQLQYGNIQKEHWGDDYREAFNISRVPNGLTFNSSALTDNTVSSYIPYKMTVINGGTVLGMYTSGITAADIAYPLPTSNSSDSTKSDGIYVMLQGGTIRGGEAYDGVQRLNLWLNIWSGDWPVSKAADGYIGGHSHNGVLPTTSAYRFVVDTKCYEVTKPSYAPNAYSIQLGYATANGAPIQTHKGAIEVRGRWT